MKTLFRATMLIILSLTLTTCATAQAGNATTGTGATTAAQLAAALNAMNEGSARASGDTVTLTKGTNIPRDLTVPAGVTLDLTALPDNDSLNLRDGVTLTVNGTVNVRGGWGNTGHGGSLNIDNGAVVINGNGTINLTGKGNLIHIWGGNGKKLTLDGVTLVGIADNNEPLVNVNSGGELVMVSGAITGNTNTDDDWASGGGVIVSGGIFTMSGGTISGNSAVGTRGSGGCRFTMSGGAINGNSVTRYGGGVMIQGSGSTFIMEDGRIQGGTDSDGFTKNTATLGYVSLAVNANYDTVKWSTGGTYTKGGVNQTGGGNIGDTNDTLIAIPAR